MTNTCKSESMVDRVAREIVRAGIGELDIDQWPEEMQQVFLRQARAAINAMRDFDDNMTEVWFSRETDYGLWCDMIDAAIKE